MKRGSDEQDILLQKRYVIELLNKQEKKILIIIDDIDRLSNIQICQVFQLITSMENFPNTRYLLAFDKEIVVKALEKVQEGSGEDYLEKIIQMPIQVPEVQKSDLRTILFEKLDKIIFEQKEVSFSSKRWQRLYMTCIDPFIKSIRDINRLCNISQFKLAAMSLEVDLADIVAISALEMAFPSVYDWVKANKSILTGKDDISAITKKYKSHKEWYEHYYREIKLMLNNDENTETIMTYLSYIFSYFGRKIGSLYEEYESKEFRKYNPIAHPDKFDRYFQLNLDNISLKKADIFYAINIASGDELVSFILKQDKDNNSYELLEEIIAGIEEIPLERIKVIVNALFEVSNQLDYSSQKNILTLNSSNFAKSIMIDLIAELDSTERLDFLSKILDNANTNVIERDFGKIISEDELFKLEEEFSNKVKETLETNNLFNFNDWRMVCHLMKSFDPKYINSYLEEALNNNYNILRYLEGSISIWTGSRNEYEINDKYKEYLTDERGSK